MDDATAQKMLSSGKQVSIYYQGDNDSKKGWRKIEPVRIEGEGDDKVMVAYEVEGLGKKPVLKKYVQKKITNWNVLSTTPATIAAKEKEKEKKAPKKPSDKQRSDLKISNRELGEKGKDFCEAVVNKRVGRFYYKGDEEESPGWRNEVQPVCYGSRKGVKYIRAWVGSGKSVSGEKEVKPNPLPGWRFFREDRIEKWEIVGVYSNKFFNKPPEENFNPRGDKLLDTIFCISDFAPGIAPEEEDKKLQEASILSAIKEAINIF
jgi:hypothetical protein